MDTPALKHPHNKKINIAERGMVYRVICGYYIPSLAIYQLKDCVALQTLIFCLHY